MNKVYPLNSMPLSALDQLAVRKSLYIDDSASVCYGRYKLPEHPTNDLVKQRHDLVLPAAR